MPIIKNTLKTPEEWAKEYEEVRGKYERFCNKLHEPLEELLNSESIRYSIIEKRAKSIQSFKKKLQRGESKYKNPLEDIEDLSGLRIILYYQDDVDKVCKLLDKEFKMLETEDKSVLLSDDQFGYLSVHKIVSISNDRSKLPEWKAFQKFKAEIQVRTVLQHAWASISHEVYYKSQQEIPVQLRRRLNRLAGLMELADEEFVSINEQQSNLGREIKEKIEQMDFDIPIDALSLKNYMAISKTVIKIREIIRELKSVNLFIDEREVDMGYSMLITVCEIFGIYGIGDLDKKLSSNLENVSRFIIALFNNIHNHGESSGFPIFIIEINSMISQILIGINRNKVKDGKLEELVGLPKDYLEYIIDAGEVFDK